MSGIGLGTTYVSIVDLDNIETSGEGALDGGNPRHLQVFNILQAHLLRRGVI